MPTYQFEAMDASGNEIKDIIDAPSEEDDLFRILSQAGPEEIADTDAPEACALESYDETPTYEL